MLLVTFAALAETGLPPDAAPVADAGLGLMAAVGDTVVLNGSASTDPEGAELTYAWSQTGGPEVKLKDASTAKPQLTLEAPGTHRFALVVDDGVNASEPDTVEIVVPERSFGGDGAGCRTAGGPSVLGVLAAGVLFGARRRDRA